MKLKIPFGYDLAKNLKGSEGNFFWLRQLEPDFEKNIFVYYEDYNENELADFSYAFNDDDRSIENVRKKIANKFLTDSELSLIHI